MNMNKIKVIVWDFNGTILDDFQVCLDSINIVLKKYFQPTLTKEEYLDKFSFPIRDYYQAIGLDENLGKFEDFAKEYMELFHKNFEKIGLFQDAINFIREDKEHQHVLISATKESNLLQQTYEKGISDLFDKIIGIGDIYAKGKFDQVKDWLDSSNYQADEVLMVGDTSHDYEIANLLRMNCCLVDRGHMSYQRLKMINENVFKDIEGVKEYVRNK